MHFGWRHAIGGFRTGKHAERGHRDLFGMAEDMWIKIVGNRESDMGSALSPAMLGRIENAVPRDRGVSPKEVAEALGASLRSVRDGLLILWEDGRIGKIERRIGSHGPNLYTRNGKIAEML